MLQALGVDVGDVRVHTDPSADQASRALGANAFTVGRDVFFREGAYAPNSDRGRETLAHELTHVAQQPASAPPSPDRPLPVSEPGHPAEREAASIAHDVVRGAAPASGGGSPGSVAPRAPAVAGMVYRQILEGEPGVPMVGGKPVFPAEIEAGPSARQQIATLLQQHDLYAAFAGIAELVRSNGHREATNDERLWMINVLIVVSMAPMQRRPAPGEPAPPDPIALGRTIWESFAADLFPVAADNLELFRASYRRGMVYSLPVVEQVRQAFHDDVQATARDYLAKNRSLVLGELQEIGEAESARTTSKDLSDAASERQQAIAAMQDAAKHVIEAQRMMDQTRRIPVGVGNPGTENPGGPWLVSYFDPERPPDIPLTGKFQGWTGTMDEWWVDYIPGRGGTPGTGTGEVQLMNYEALKVTHNQLRFEVASFINQYPAVYAAMQADKLDKLAEANGPAEAHAILAETLHAVLANIVKTSPKLQGDDDFWLKLKPIHQQLTSGAVAGPSGTPWSDPARAFIAKEIVKDYEDAEFWKDIGLAVLAMAAFVVAELATAGGATFFIAAGVGMGITGYQVYEKYSEYDRLAPASGVDMGPELQLVDPAQASAARLAAILETVGAFLFFIGPAAKLARAADVALIPSNMLLEVTAAEASGLENLATRLAAKQIGEAEAKTLVERSVVEYGVEGAARRAGMEPGQLIPIVGKDSEAGRLISDYLKAGVRPTTAAPTMAQGAYSTLTHDEMVTIFERAWGRAGPPREAYQVYPSRQAFEDFAGPLFPDRDPKALAGFFDSATNIIHVPPGRRDAVGLPRGLPLGVPRNELLGVHGPVRGRGHDGDADAADVRPAVVQGPGVRLRAEHRLHEDVRRHSRDRRPRPGLLGWRVGAAPGEARHDPRKPRRDRQLHRTLAGHPPSRRREPRPGHGHALAGPLRGAIAARGHRARLVQSDFVGSP